jgi:hypothetical protein
MIREVFVGGVTCIVQVSSDLNFTVSLKVRKGMLVASGGSEGEFDLRGVLGV